MSRPALLFALALAGCASRPVVVVEGQSWAVATEDRYATLAAQQILERGGNAFDAAIAATLTLGVTTPTACGLGGGGFAIVYVAKTDQIIALDFREQAPRALANLSKTSPAGAFVGVPGEAAGLGYLHEHFGSMPFADLAQFAAHTARDGFVPNAYVIRATKKILPDVDAKLPSFHSLADGDRIARPDLASTLSQLAEHGPKFFYEGSIANAIVAAVASHGGSMSLDDLRAYQVRESEPLSIELDGLAVYTMGPPSAGGLMLLQLLEADQLRDEHHLIEDATGQAAFDTRVMLNSLSDRAECFGGEMQRACGLPELLSVDHIAARLQLPSLIDYDPPDHGTSHLSIIDAEGNAIALTTTINDAFGSMIAAGDTGIVLNNELADFSLDDPDSPNAPRAGARPVSSMTPTIILSEDGDVFAIIGGSGGAKIATSVSQVTSMIVHGVPLESAIRRPRIHPTSTALVVEPTVDASLKNLLGDGYHLHEEAAVNAVNAIVRAPDGTLQAMSDPRKDGAAAAK